VLTLVARRGLTLLATRSLAEPKALLFNGARVGAPSVGAGKLVLHQPGHGEAGGHFLHFGFVVGFGLPGGVLDCAEDGLGDEAGLFFQKLGVECEREEASVAVDLDLHCATAAADFDFVRVELGLQGFDAALHFLGLFEEFSESGHLEKRVEEWV